MSPGRSATCMMESRKKFQQKVPKLVVTSNTVAIDQAGLDGELRGGRKAKWNVGGFLAFEGSSILTQ